MPFIEQLGQQAAGMALDTGLGILLSKHQDKRQVKQQQKLQALQIAGTKDLTDYQFAKQLQMWKDTNFAAQMQELKRAGLNPGLLYGMGGAGGALTGGGGAEPTGAVATQAGGGEFGIAMAARMQQAQIDLLKAQASNLNADTANKPATGKQIETQTLDLLTGIENKKAQLRLQNLQADIEEIKLDIAGKTKDQAIELIDTQLEQAHSIAEKLFRANVISKATQNDTIDKVTADLALTWADKYLKDAQTTTEKGKPFIQASEIDLMRQQAMALIRQGAQRWRELELKGDTVEQAERKLNEELTKDNMLPDDLVQTIIGILIGRGIAGKATTTPVRGFHTRD